MRHAHPKPAAPFAAGRLRRPACLIDCFAPTAASVRTLQDVLHNVALLGSTGVDELDVVLFGPPGQVDQLEEQCFVVSRSLTRKRCKYLLSRYLPSRQGQTDAHCVAEQEAVELFIPTVWIDADVHARPGTVLDNPPQAFLALVERLYDRLQSDVLANNSGEKGASPKSLPPPCLLYLTAKPEEGTALAGFLLGYLCVYCLGGIGQAEGSHAEPTDIGNARNNLADEPLFLFRTTLDQSGKDEDGSRVHKDQGDAFPLMSFSAPASTFTELLSHPSARSPEAFSESEPCEADLHPHGEAGLRYAHAMTGKLEMRVGQALKQCVTRGKQTKAGTNKDIELRAWIASLKPHVVVEEMRLPLVGL